MRFSVTSAHNVFKQLVILSLQESYSYKLTRNFLNLIVFLLERAL